jgi:hypothetical protein
MDLLVIYHNNYCLEEKKMFRVMLIAGITGTFLQQSGSDQPL